MAFTRAGEGDTGEILPDGRRRLPPGQWVTAKWPILHVGDIPSFDPETWDFQVSGLVEEPLRYTWAEFSALPRIESVSDIHCVTTWSRYDNQWGGVATREILGRARPRPEARFVLVSAENEYTTNLLLDRFAEADCLLATHWSGKPLEPAHGYPLRLVVPGLYFWKSAKWIRKIELAAADRPGFWEVRGYANTAEPWREDRYS